MVIPERGIDGKLKQNNTAASQYLREDPPAALVILEPKHGHADSGSHTDCYPTKLAYPAVVKRVLEEEGGREKDQADRRPPQPSAAYD